MAEASIREINLRKYLMTQANTGIDLSKYQLGWSDDEDYVFKPTKGLNEDLVEKFHG